MLRRTPLAVSAAALAVVLALPAAAFALSVHVRVEGPKGTIFGATEPRVTPFAGKVPVRGGDPLDLSGPTALGTLAAASREGGFRYVLSSSSVGAYVSQVGRAKPSGTSGWVFKVNGVSPTVGSDATRVEAGDEVLWYYATFGPKGGPATLDLARSSPGCYRVFAVDDRGRRSRARKVTFRLDRRSIRSQQGAICPAGSWHRLRATKKGTIRSQVIDRA